MRLIILIGSFILVTASVFSQRVKVISPNQKIQIELEDIPQTVEAGWTLKVSYESQGEYLVIIPIISLGLSRHDQDFSKGLKFLKANNPLLINEQYKALHGKKSLCSNMANEVVISFENQNKARMNLILRAYNDGIAFRYEFPGSDGKYKILDELTSYYIPDSTYCWLEKFDLSNEGLYTEMYSGDNQQNWCYPALFKSTDDICWYLIHEADLDRSYCASKLSNINNKTCYKVTLPQPDEGEGEAQPAITLPWKSPWRVIILGSLSDIVESTLVDDVSDPSVLKNTEWIKPGLVSWNYWSNNHGTKDFKTVCEFADLAATMNWPYTLLDWEWDVMENGGNLEDAAQYILSKGVKPLIWYNSGAFKWIQATPVDRMLTHENRIEEFAKLKKMGFAGVKIDFFINEKQSMISYYLDILEDAAKYEMMVYFHGCLVPRGWTRTYPHLMTYEGVRGAEWYNNGPEFTTTAPQHNTILPFTRNVIGAMDYTPVTFTNSQYPHITSYGHELALSIVFESSLQHMADRPKGYYQLPDAAKTFLREVPCSWDNIKLLDGFPGRDIQIARQKGEYWFIGGLNSEPFVKNKTISFHFLEEGKFYKLTLISDGEHDKSLNVKYMVIDNNGKVDVRLLGRGGFIAVLKPV